MNTYKVEDKFNGDALERVRSDHNNSRKYHDFNPHYLQMNFGNMPLNGKVDETNVIVKFHDYLLHALIGMNRWK